MSLLLLGVAAGLAGCSTPCDAPGRLCAPITSITSPASPPAAPVAAPRPAPAPPPARVETFAIAMPGAAGQSETAGTAMPSLSNGQATAPAADMDAIPSNTPLRVALLLPLRSDTLGQAAAAVKAGFLAAWERDRDGVTVTVADTGDATSDVLATYASAQEQADLIVGPLGRSAVGALAASPLLRKPTIALNTPEGYGNPGQSPLPPRMLAMGLSIEEEARQAANWAASEHPGASALVLATSTPWQRRIATAFASQWQRQGLAVRTVELGAANGYLNDPELVQLRARLQTDAPGLLFAALDAAQTRQLRGALEGALPEQPPIYGTSSLNPGNGSNFPTQELDGVRLLDLPWQLQADHPAVMVYPHPPQSEERKPGAADLERLYALGIDAYRVAREIGHHAGVRFQLDGVTGRLTVSFGLGPASFERIEQAAVYKNGVPQPVAP
ncbi:penicillin-binding protein activator [Rugamonas brunnea]|uniref:penicillin-binding protein activator n=1 Tax=Rugamonas brunnea TaxID=2758569 RepID=UPI002883334E|nr:penicillin-binding protein activator [Rugamonas brunnea]